MEASVLSVSGIDDLTPDEHGNIDEDPAVRTQLSGFAYIGVPVRRLVESSGVACVHVYLGTCTERAKTFASKIFLPLAEGRLRLPGKGTNRMAVVHVEDAARALIHIAGLEKDRAAGRSFVVTDGHPPALAD